MKKIAFILVAITCAISLLACGNNSDSGNVEDKQQASTDNTPSTAALKSQLSDIEKELNKLYDNYSAIASTILDKWDPSGVLMTCYFDEAYCKKSNGYTQGTFKREYDSFWKLKNESAQSLLSVMTKIKQITPNDEIKEYHNAIKDYYTSINSFKELVTAYPSGYSQVSYATAIKDAKEKATEIKSGLTFYK